MSPRSTRFPAIEGLRALAAIAVVLIHVATYSHSRGSDPAGRLLSSMGIGVTMFFVISGFVLYRPFIVARGRNRGVPLRSYARRRFMRIGPPYWVALTILALWPGLRGAVLGDQAVKYYGLLQVYTGEEGGIIPAWSLCTEVAFYCTLPLIAWTLGRIARLQSARGPLAELGVLGALGFASAVFHSLALSRNLGYEQMSRTLLANFDWFALGMGIAVLSADPGILSKLVERLFARPVFMGVLSAFLYVAMAFGTGENHLLEGLICAILVGAVVLGPESALSRSLSAATLTSVGLVSYSLFLWHDPLARWASATLSDEFPYLLLVTLSMSLPLAYLSYHLVEKPSMKLGHSGSAKQAAAMHAGIRTTPTPGTPQTESLS